MDAGDYTPRAFVQPAKAACRVSNETETPVTLVPETVEQCVDGSRHVVAYTVEAVCQGHWIHKNNPVLGILELPLHGAGDRPDHDCARVLPPKHPFQRTGVLGDHDIQADRETPLLNAEAQAGIVGVVQLVAVQFSDQDHDAAPKLCRSAARASRRVLQLAGNGEDRPAGLRRDGQQRIVVQDPRHRAVRDANSFGNVLQLDHAVPTPPPAAPHIRHFGLSKFY